MSEQGKRTEAERRLLVELRDRERRIAKTLDYVRALLRVHYHSRRPGYDPISVFESLEQVLRGRGREDTVPPFAPEDVTTEDVRAIAHCVPRQAMAGLMRHEFEAVIAAAWNRLRERG